MVKINTAVLITAFVLWGATVFAEDPQEAFLSTYPLPAVTTKSKAFNSITPNTRIAPTHNVYLQDYLNLDKNRKKFNSLIDAASSKYKISAHLIHAIIHTESLYNPQAVSKAGAAGLMQLMPATAKALNVSDRFDPKQNINAGVKYFNHLMIMFHDNIQLSLAAYNAGETAVRTYGNSIPPYPETQKYVKRVMKIYHERRYNRSYH